MPGDEVAAELASSPTAQGGGPAPDNQQTDQSSLVAQPGDAQQVSLDGAEIQMPEERVGRSAVSVKSSSKGMNPGARKGAEVPHELSLGELNDFGNKQMSEVDAALAKQQSAVGEQARITQAADAREADIQRQIAEENKLWAGVDERTAAASAAEAHKYVAAFEAQKAAVRQMAVDPTGPIGSMTAGQAAGMSMANFAQGFLNARYGIHIDVAGQIDKWVDRSIQEQQRKIAAADAGANDQLHLLEIARQTSHDQAEAHQRYRGLVIAGMQGSLMASASQYKSDMATANATATNAALEVEAVKSKQSIWNNVQTRVEAHAQRQEQIRHDTALESLQSQANEIKALKEAANAAKGPEYIPVDDPETPGTPKWLVDKKDPEARKGALEARAAAGIMMKKIDSLDKAYTQAFGKYGKDNAPWMISDALASPEVRNYQRAQKEVALGMLEYGHSHRYSDNHLAELKSLIPGEKGWQRGDNADAINALKEDVRGTFEGAMDTYAAVGRGQTAMPKLNEQHAVREAASQGAPPVETPTGQEVALGEKSELSRPFEKPTKLWSGLMPGAQPMSSIAVDHLALALSKPDVFRATHASSKDAMPEDDSLLRKQSVDALRHLEGTAPDAQTRTYAHAILERYHEGGATAISALFAGTDAAPPTE